MSRYALLLFIFYNLCQASKTPFEDSDRIEHLSQDNFEKRVLNNDRVWLVEFYDPSDEKSSKSVSEIEKTARILAGIAKVGVVDIAKNKVLAHSYDANQTPTVLLFGANKEKPKEYKGKILAEQLTKKVGAQIKDMVRNKESKEPDPKKDVKKLTSENFSRKVLESDGIWFVKYYDPNCGHSKAFAPEYAKAASTLKGAVNFGAVNMDVEIYDEMGKPYDIEKVPTIKIFGVDKVKPGEYSGPRKATDLVERALEEMELLVKKRFQKESSDDLYGAPEDSEEEDGVKKVDKKDKTQKIDEVTDLKKEKEEKETKEDTDKDKRKDKEKKKAKKEEKAEDKEKKHKKKEANKADKKEAKEEL